MRKDVAAEGVITEEGNEEEGGRMVTREVTQDESVQEE